jgi:hypothetical protein
MSAIIVRLGMKYLLIKRRVNDKCWYDIGIKDWHIQKLKDEIKDLKDALEKTE